MRGRAGGWAGAGLRRAAETGRGRGSAGPPGPASLERRRVGKGSAGLPETRYEFATYAVVISLPRRSVRVDPRHEGSSRYHVAAGGPRARPSPRSRAGGRALYNGGVRARLFLALLAAFALLSAPAPAQEPTPTPTATPTPTPTPTPEPAPERSDKVKAIFRDYRRDGEIDACEHDRPVLRSALKSLTDEEDLENPDLRYLLEAAIDEHKSGDCEEQAAERRRTTTRARSRRRPR